MVSKQYSQNKTCQWYRRQQDNPARQVSYGSNGDQTHVAFRSCRLLVRHSLVLAAVILFTALLSLTRADAAVPTPPSPYAVAGSFQVTVSWNIPTIVKGTVTARYNIKRATVSGGPYSFVTSNTTVLFVDKGLSNTTTYYYVVSGVNSSGEGANSAEVSATPPGTGTVSSAPINVFASAIGQQITVS